MSDRNRAIFKYNTEVLGYHPYLSVALSALAYLLFALLIFANHKQGIVKNYAHNVFLILGYAFTTDIFETGQTVYFIFNMPEQRETLPTTVRTCTFSLWLFVFHYLSSSFVDAIVSIYHFIVRFCGKDARDTTVYSAFGIFIATSMSCFASAHIFGEETFSNGGIGPVVCGRYYAVHRYVFLAGCLSYIAVGIITPIFPILTLIKGAAKQRNQTGLTSFLLLSALPAAFILISSIIESFAWHGQAQPKIFQAIIHVLFTFQQFRFPMLCLLATLLVPELRGAVFSTIRTLFISDVSVAINVDVLHLEAGQKKHIEKVLTA